MVFVGSPPCTAFSSWNIHINFAHMPAHNVDEIIHEGVLHLRFMISVYKLQHDGHRFFRHEHPAGAGSWSDPHMKQLLALDGDETAIADQCEYGLATWGPDGQPVLAKKPTQWASNSPFILRRLSKRCSGTHSHQHLEGGRAKKAET